MLQNKQFRPRRLFKLLPLLLLVAACATGALQEKILTMPTIEGAKFVGNKACADCHEEVNKAFTSNVHGRLADFELQGWEKGCESCHGMASLHVDGDGDTAKILNPAKLDPTEAEAICVGCHTSGGLMDWTHSEHSLSNVTCTDCHSMHGEGTAKANLKKSDPELCYGCHQEQMAKASFPSHHPIKEGKMNCGDCHNPHGELNTHERTNDLCLDCHSRYQGPFVFGHAPVEDDCTICHDPHGSVASNLLAQNEPFLCLQCHEGHFHILRKGFDPDAASPVYNTGDKAAALAALQAANGGSDRFDTAADAKAAVAALAAADKAGVRFFYNKEENIDGAGTAAWRVYTRATTDTTLTDRANPHGDEGWQKSFGTKCTTCHQVVHGSDFPSQPLSGGGLTR